MRALKKLTAIALLVLFLFNLAGYRLFFYYAQIQSDTKIEASLDRELYNETDLITLKVDLSMPYQTGQTDFERIDGEITIDGKLYKYVKRKIQAGQLILLCIPDNNKISLEASKEDFFKNTNSLTQNKNTKEPDSKRVIVKNQLTDFDRHATEYLMTVQTGSRPHYNSVKSSGLISSSHNSPEQPPELS